MINENPYLRPLNVELLEERQLLTQLRIAAWNTMNLPDTPAQDAFYSTVLQAMRNETVAGVSRRLSILALAETDPPSAARVRDVANSTYGTTAYQMVVSTPDFGGDSTGFVYDTAAVTLLSHVQLAGSFTHTMLRGKFRPAMTFGESDFFVYALHLKSGTDAADIAKRQAEMSLLRADADALGEGAHVLFVGDFNMQSSSEGAWSVATGAGNAQLADVINAPGNWSNNPAFVRWHTQNTAFMLRRLDLQMVSGEVNDNVGFDYVDNTFRVFGNNGTHGLGNPITAGTGAAPNVLSALAQASDHLPIVAEYFVPPSQLVQIFQSGGGTLVTEAGLLDTVRVSLNLVPTHAVTVTLAGNAEIDLGSGPGSSRTLTFTPANALIPQTIVVSAVDDQLSEGTEEVFLGFSTSSLDATFHNLNLPPLRVVTLDNEAPSLVINEVDSDTLGVDNLEFIELYDGGVGGRSLDGLVLVLYDGDTDRSYAAFDLDGYVTGPGGFFVVGNSAVANVNLVIPDDLIQNGADAVALYMANATDFPNNSPIRLTDLIDAVVYGTDDPNDPQLLTLLLPGQHQPNENANNLRNFESVSRLPDSGVPRTTTGMIAQTATPGRSNMRQTPGILLIQPQGTTAVTEGGAGSSYTLNLESIPSASVSITVDPDDQLDVGAGPGAPRVFVFTPLNALAPQTVTVTAVDDSNFEGSHTGRISHSVSSSDANYQGFVIPELMVSITDNDIPYLVINELDSDTPGTDMAEFVELWDGGRGNTPLDGFAVVFFNGFDDSQYYGVNLNGFRTNSEGFFLLGNPMVPGVNLVFPNNTLQNGADAVALYRGSFSSFPTVTTTNLVDAVVYGTSDPDDPGLLVLLQPGQPQVDEDVGGNRVINSIARVPDGGLARVTMTYRAQTPTPGARNAPPPGVDGDFDDDGDYDCVDVDGLVAAIVGGMHPPAYDLTGDGFVNQNDLTAWLAEAGAVNLPGGVPYRPGDADLNGQVNNADFAIWDTYKFTLSAAWCRADYDASGGVDGVDFGLWNRHRDSVMTVPVVGPVRTDRATSILDRTVDQSRDSVHSQEPWGDSPLAAGDVEKSDRRREGDRAPAAKLQATPGIAIPDCAKAVSTKSSQLHDANRLRFWKLFRRIIDGWT